MTNGFIAISDEQSIQMGVGIEQRQIPRTRRKSDLVNRCSEFDVAAEETRQLGRAAFVHVDEMHMTRHKPNACQLPAHPNERGRPKFDLMPIPVTTNPSAMKTDGHLLAIDALLHQAFIDDGGVARSALEGVEQYLRGSDHVVVQANLSQIVVPREVETQQIITERLSDKSEEFDLVTNPQRRLSIKNLMLR